MESAEYCNKLKELHESLLLFIESNDDNDERLINFLQICDFFQISQTPNKLKRLLLLLSVIAENHYRSPDFFTKIEQILINFESNIKQHFTHDEIFNIFRNNKRIILLLIEIKILTETFIINTIAKIDDHLKRDELYLYFFHNIKQFLSHRKQKFIGKKYKKIASNYETIRNLSENESYICIIIRNDLIEEFVAYTTRANIPLSSQIQPTLFETNSFLLRNKPTLIEYATFFGSIQIFKYLQFNNVYLSPFLWLYAIHSNNGEIIHLLEELNIIPKNKEELLIESIKCHHNSIVNYFFDTIFYNESYKYIETCFKYYNYSILPKEIDEEMLNNLISYSYDDLVKLLIKERLLNSDMKIHVNLMNYFIILFIYLFF